MELDSRLLAEYALDVAYDDIPPAAIERVERFAFDVLGCAIGAYATPAIKSLRSVYGNRPPASGEPAATVLGTGRAVPPEYAALLNSSMGRYFDYNDVYDGGTSVCHPSDHVGTLLAVAESEGRTGREFLAALVAAYEIQCRLVDSGRMWANGFDYVTWGGHAAAAAVGSLMGLSADQIADAIGMVAASSNGLLVTRQDAVSTWKGVAEGYVLHNAVQACQLARGGLTGPPEVYSGTGGLFEAVTGGPVDIPDFPDEGGDYRVLRTNFKPYACAYVTQSAITAATDLVADHGIDLEAIESIHVRTFERAMHSATPEKWATDLTHETADHSMPYTIAVALVDGEVTPAQYREERLRDERVHRLMDAVSVEEDDDLTARQERNPGYSPSQVVVETASGRHERRVDYPLGHPERPMSDERLEAKVTDLVDPYLSAEQVETMRSLCYGLEDLDDVGRLSSALTV